MPSGSRTNPARSPILVIAVLFFLRVGWTHPLRRARRSIAFRSLVSGCRALFLVALIPVVHCRGMVIRAVSQSTEDMHHEKAHPFFLIGIESLRERRPRISAFEIGSSLSQGIGASTHEFDRIYLTLLTELSATGDRILWLSALSRILGGPCISSMALSAAWLLLGIARQVCRRASRAAESAMMH